MLEKTLQNIGLSEKQAKIYLALLELGQATVQSLARRAKINRPTAYVILEEMLKEKLVFSAPAEKKVYYRAAAPESLADWMKAKKRELTDKTQELRLAVKDIKARYEPGARATVRYFEGREGLLAMTNEIYYIAKSKKARMFYPLDLIKEVFREEELKKFKDIRLQRQLPSRALYTSVKEIKKNTPDGERILVDAEKYKTACDISFHSDYIRIASLQNKLAGILIQNTAMAQAMIFLFELAWLGARSQQKEAEDKIKQ